MDAESYDQDDSLARQSHGRAVGPTCGTSAPATIWIRNEFASIRFVLIRRAIFPSLFLLSPIVVAVTHTSNRVTIQATLFTVNRSRVVYRKPKERTLSRHRSPIRGRATWQTSPRVKVPTAAVAVVMLRDSRRLHRPNRCGGPMLKMGRRAQQNQEEDLDGRNSRST